MPDLPILGLVGLAALIAVGFAWRLVLFFRLLRAAPRADGTRAR